MAVAERESRARRSERDRIADTLHDDIAPMLFIARLLLEGRTDERTVRAAELLERSERALRDVVDSLSAPLDPRRPRGGRWPERYRVPITFVSTVATLDAAIEQALARVGTRGDQQCGQALRLAARSTSALTASGDRLLLTVVNDGVPRDHTTPAGGRGLASLRRDLRRSGGDLEFALNPSGGARLHAWVPAR